MGLLVSATAEKKILIQGTEIKLKSVYVRVEYSARANGVTLEIAPTTYTSHEVYKAGGDVVLTDVPQSNITIDLVEGQMQDLSSAEFYAKANYEELGYAVEVL
jgi:hypothetical protein